MCGANRSQAAGGSIMQDEAGGAGPGSHGPPSKGASSKSLSDPHAPHRLQAELETLSQFSQKTARSSGIEMRPGSFLIICTLHMTTSCRSRATTSSPPLLLLRCGTCRIILKCGDQALKGVQIADGRHRPDLQLVQD